MSQPRHPTKNVIPFEQKGVTLGADLVETNKREKAEKTNTPSFNYSSMAQSEPSSEDDHDKDQPSDKESDKQEEEPPAP